MNKKGLALLVAMIMVATLVMPVFAASMPFADVPKDHWAYDSVAEMVASGLVIGYPDGTFKGERQFTRYEMAMVFARVLGRLDTLIAAEVGAEVKAGVKGLSDDIYAQVAQALAEEMAKVKAELTAHVDSELANLELPEAKVVERVVVEKPTEVVRPFELTDDAKAVIAKVVADMVAENVANLEPQVVEKLVEAEPGLSAKDLQGLMAAVANAQTTADFNAMDIADLQADVAAARQLIDDVAFNVQVNDAIVGVADKKADRAMSLADAAKADAAEAKALGTSATEQALAALKGAEAASEEAAAATAAVQEANQEIRNLAITMAALEGDVDTLRVLLEDTSKAMESEMAAMTEEFGSELASLGVRVSDLENIVVDQQARIDALEADVDQLKADTVDDVVSLRVADRILKEELDDLSDAHAETADLLVTVDAEQKATATDFAGFKADHEKVKLSGSTTTKFQNVGIVTNHLVGDKDPDERKGVYKDPRDEDDDEIYKRTAKLQQEFVLNLEATPAEGVSVKATLADTADIFGDTDNDAKFTMKNITLDVTTDKALRSFYAGERDEADVAARYNEFVIHDERGDMEVVAANVVLGKLDTEVQLFRPWDADEDADSDPDLLFKDHKANYGALVNSAYTLSDAFVIDLQYGRMWFDDTADTGMSGQVEDWAYSLGLRGELTFADYEVAYAANDKEKTGYKISVGKAYGPEPEEDADDLRPTWNVTYKAVDEGYDRYLTDDDIDKYESDLKLTADQFNLFGLNLGGAYATKKANVDADDDVTAMKLTAEKKDLFLTGLTVSGQYANIDSKKIVDGGSLLGKIAYEPTFGNLKLGASYEYTTNAITGDFDNPGKWVEGKKVNDVVWGKAVPEATTKLSAEYPVDIWDTTITGFVGYENRTSDMKLRHGREYENALMTYRVSAERAIGSADVLASYQYRTGGPNNPDKTKYDEAVGSWAGSDPEIDKIAEVKVTYPVVDDVADLELGYRHVDVEAYDTDYNYTATELNAGLKFTF